VNFDSYTDRVVGTAVSLVNVLTPGQDGGRPLELAAELAGDPTSDRARDPAGDIARRCLAVVGRPVTRAEATELVALAGRLRPVFEAAEGGRADRVAELVNALLRDYRAAPELSRHDGEPWHLHYRSTAAGLATEWGAGCAVGLAVVVDSQATGRLGVCGAGCCDRVFVDVSRNASRRFCSEACLNRTKVAAFRARARATT
jgi:predicted RNA-binding Zn ribbon-like protein